MAIPGLNEDIYVMNADGTSPGPSDQVNEQFDSWPLHGSPDGTRIAYVHRAGRQALRQQF